MRVRAGHVAVGLSAAALFCSVGGPAWAVVAANEVVSTSIKDGEVKAVDIATGAVTSSKILDGQVGGVDLAANSVTTAKILDGTVGAADIGAGAVGTSELATSGVTAADIATGAVATDEILNGSVGNLDLAANAVNGAKILDGSVGVLDLGLNSVSTGEVALDSLTENDLDTDAVGSDELQFGSVLPEHLAEQEDWAPTGDELPEDEVMWITFPDSSAYASGADAVQSYLDGFGVVHLRGGIVAEVGSVSADATCNDAAILPEDMRPDQEAQFAVPNGNNVNQVHVLPSGVIQVCGGSVNTTSDGYRLDGVAFRVAPPAEVAAR